MWLFYVQQEILYEFPVVHKRFAKDAHSRDRKIVACEILLIGKEYLFL